MKFDLRSLILSILFFSFSFGQIKAETIYLEKDGVTYRMYHGVYPYYSAYGYEDMIHQASFRHYAVVESVVAGQTTLEVPEFVEKDDILYKVVDIDDMALLNLERLKCPVSFFDHDYTVNLINKIALYPLSLEIVGYYDHGLPNLVRAGSILWGDQNYKLRELKAPLHFELYDQYLDWNHPHAVVINSGATQQHLLVNYYNGYNNFGETGGELEVINIGCSVENVELYCNKCPRLSTINCMSPVPPQLSLPLAYTYDDDPDPLAFLSRVTLHVPVGCRSAYMEAEVWNQVADIIDDLDLAGNTVTAYTESNGLIYGVYDDERPWAAVICPVRRDISAVEIESQVEINGMTFDVEKIADCAFLNCLKLEDIHIPEGIVKVGDMAFCITTDQMFGEASHRNPILMPNSISHIGDMAFQFTPVVNLPNNLCYIGDHGLYNSLDNLAKGGISEYDYMNSLYLPKPIRLNEGLEYLGEDALYMSVPTLISLPSTLTYMGSQDRTGVWVGAGYKGFSEIVVKKLSTSHLFNPMYSSATDFRFEVPDGVTALNSTEICARTIVIGKDVKSIGDCSIGIPGPVAYDKYDIVVLADNPPKIWPSSVGLSYNEFPASYPDHEEGFINLFTVHVKKGEGERYRSDEGWSMFANIVEDLDSDYIEYADGDWIFKLNRPSNTASVVKYLREEPNWEEPFVIPESVEYEGVKYAVTNIQSFAFNNPFLGEGIVLPSHLESIENCAFGGFDMTQAAGFICTSQEPPFIPTAYSLVWPCNEDMRVYLYNGDGLNVIVPKGTLAAYQESAWGRLFNIYEDEESLIEDVVISPIEGSEDAPLYNLIGQIVKDPAPGIYIRNGRKVVVR